MSNVKRSYLKQLIDSAAEYNNLKNELNEFDAKEIQHSAVDGVDGEKLPFFKNIERIFNLTENVSEDLSQELFDVLKKYGGINKLQADWDIIAENNTKTRTQIELEMNATEDMFYEYRRFLVSCHNSPSIKTFISMVDFKLDECSNVHQIENQLLKSASNEYYYFSANRKGLFEPDSPVEKYGNVFLTQKGLELIEQKHKNIDTFLTQFDVEFNKQDFEMENYILIGRQLFDISEPGKITHNISNSLMREINLNHMKREQEQTSNYGL